MTDALQGQWLDSIFKGDTEVSGECLEGRAIVVWSRALMVHSSPWNGRMRYGPSSAWERPHDGGSASRDRASSSEPEGVGPAPRDQPEDGRQVEEAPLGPGRTHRP